MIGSYPNLNLPKSNIEFNKVYFVNYAHVNIHREIKTNGLIFFQSPLLTNLNEENRLISAFKRFANKEIKVVCTYKQKVWGVSPVDTWKRIKGIVFDRMDKSSIYSTNQIKKTYLDLVAVITNMFRVNFECLLLSHYKNLKIKTIKDALTYKKPSTGVLAVLYSLKQNPRQITVISGFSFQFHWSDKNEGKSMGDSLHKNIDIKVLRELSKSTNRLRTTEPIVNQLCGVPML